MFALTKFKLLLKKYKSIFSDILGDMELEKIENNEIIFKNKNDEYLIANIINENISFYYKNDVLEKYIHLKFPNKNDDISNIKMIETVKESRSNGTIIEQIERIYGLSRFSDTEKVLTDLIATI